MDTTTKITRMDDQGMIVSFGAWQRGRSFSPHTIRRRDVSLRRFVTYIAPADLRGATPVLVEDWVSTLNAPRTRHAYRSDISSFYRWAVKRGLTMSNPVDGTDSVRVPKGLPRPVNPTIVPAIIAAADDPDTRLMVALAAYAGLRRAEIAVLTSDDIALHTVPPMLAVRSGKGRKDRLVPIHPALITLLSRRRTAGPLFDVTAQTVGQRVTAHLVACGITATCHQLRHSFGTELARITGGNLVLIALLMGHEDTNTTKGYIGWSGGEGSTAVSGLYGGAA